MKVLFNKFKVFLDEIPVKLPRMIIWIKLDSCHTCMGQVDFRNRSKSRAGLLKACKVAHLSSFAVVILIPYTSIQTKSTFPWL